MNVVLKSLAVFLTVTTAVQAEVTFAIWKQISVKASAGVLMVTVDGDSIGPVCQRHYSDTEYYMSSATAEEVCKHASYHSLEKVDLLRYGFRSTSFLPTFQPSNYSFAAQYLSKIYNLQWTDDRFNYKRSNSCKSTYYYTFISCQCSTGFYNGTEGCMKCPAGSISPVHSSICHCPAGQHWTGGHCNNCTKNTYSTANTTACTACTPGSYSREGSMECHCDDGLYMVDNGTCKPCEVDYYSYNRSNVCTQCPGNSTAVRYQGFCSCSAGQRWEFNLGQDQDHQAGTCEECVADNYSKYNSTDCTPCPLHSTSPYNSPRCYCQHGYKWVEMNATRDHTHGATTLYDHCEICPENHISKFGALNCTQCSHFKAAMPGSEYCYRCTLGQYWKNHTCLQCPKHLFGDGVHCNKCPEGFKVLHGFCYRDSDGVVVDEGSYSELDVIVGSSAVSYFSAVLTFVLVYFGYSKRKLLRKFMNFLNCWLAVKADLREDVGMTVGFNDFMETEGEQVVRSEDDFEDTCCEGNAAPKIVENEHEDI